MVTQELDILFEDNHLIIVNKPCGVLVQGDKTGDIPLLEIIKQYIKKKYNKKGNVYVGLVNRIDRPTSGIVIFTKTSKALSRMNDKLKNREIRVRAVFKSSGGIQPYVTISDSFQVFQSSGCNASIQHHFR